MTNALTPILDHLDQIPAMLYKYCRFDKNGYGLKLAASGEVHFASVDRFNDPFDSYFVMKWESAFLSPAELRANLTDRSKRHFPNASRQELDWLVALAMKRALEYRRNPDMMDQVSRMVQNSALGVSSFVPHPDSLPMWAYYAADHCGFCVGLRTDVLGVRQEDLLVSNHLIELYRVTYSEDVPILGEINGPSFEPTEEEMEEIMRTIYTKSSAWAHEEEFRLVAWRNPNWTVVFGPEAIGEVIIGLRAADGDVDALLKALEAAKSTAVVKRARSSSTRYALEFDPLN